MSGSPAREARRTLLDWLRALMVGPHQGDPEEAVHAGERRIYAEREKEAIQQTPYDFYHTGYLSPPRTSLDSEEDEQDSQDTDLETGAGESIMTLANAAQQSAMGLTFQAGSTKATFELVATWGEYVLEAQESSRRALEGQRDGAVASVPLVWRRRPFRLSSGVVLADVPENKSMLVGEADGAVLFVRRRQRGGLEFVTVSLVNRREWKRDERKADPRMFQAAIEVRVDGDGGGFVASTNTARRDEDDFWNQELLFRKARQFAVGHGCSVMWDGADVGHGPRSVRTEWIPECEVPKASALVMDLGPALDVDWLADHAAENELLDALEMIPDGYDEWIRACRESVPAILQGFPDSARSGIGSAAESNLGLCERQSARIRAGIRYLRDNAFALHAFRLANRAMALAMRRRRPESDPRWFPFQLAFILLAVPSSTDRRHEHRGILDLIWFPTGGGKTEAYLGLTAYVIFQRGLRADDKAEASGTAVLTRYTLRLLTVQQFERAALTILACERIRRTEPALESVKPYSIGLLVGQGATPNHIDKARELHETGDSGGGQTLLPLESCPWCGAHLGRNCLSFEEHAMITACPSGTCDFCGHIPVSVIDEQILEAPPTFVIATIDKLAQMPWEPRIGRLFGWGEPSRFPPDLIIQDELHLISDSLGTIAAQYETAVDWLCSREGFGPKIIGSTATIRRAAEQSGQLFRREAIQFPPSGTEAGDSYFYAEDRSAPGRLYVGVHAQGRSPKHTLPRVIGTLAQATEGLSPPEIRDAFYTIVAYFNSLRELGGALVIAEDDVPRYIDSLPLGDGVKRRRLVQKEELTSVVENRRIPLLLKQMEVQSHVHDDEFEPLDLVLCTNMISVGVDVDRLGVMVVAGQPKTTAEYIQASSRVGRPRGSAGLVVTQYNWTRPRDRSHYERFLGYHSAFYRFVEAVSVTPFSERARDRALRSLFASIVRIGIPTFSTNESAGLIRTGTEDWNRVNELLNVVVERVNAVDPDEAEDATRELHGILDEWVKLAERARQEDRTLYWIPWGLSKAAKRTGAFMLEADGLGRGPDGLWPSMLSMRDVDPPAPVRLVWIGRESTTGNAA